MTNIDREALLNALHEAIDGDMLIDDDGEAIGLSEAGAADVTRWAADALTEHIADAVKAAEAEGFKRGTAAVEQVFDQHEFEDGECSCGWPGHGVKVRGEDHGEHVEVLIRAALAATEDQS